MFESNRRRQIPVAWSRWIVAGLSLMVTASAGGAGSLPPTEGRQNLAAGREVQFAPLPNYRQTAKNDATDLTDGKLSSRKDAHLWFDPKTVTWMYAGRVNMAVDLGQNCQIDEIAIRLLAGSPTAGTSFPGWVEALVSGDGEHYVKVGEFCRWRANDGARFDVPQERGKAFVHCLRFTGLHARGRWVGVRLYANALTSSDELYVFGKSDGQLVAQSTKNANESPSDFSVTRIQPYFHKPELVLTTNLPLPVPVGAVVPPGVQGQQSELTLELPRGVRLVAGAGDGDDLAGLAPHPSRSGVHKIKLLPKTTNKVVARLYLQADGLADGEQTSLAYSFQTGGWQSPVMALPIRAVTVAAAKRPKRLMTSLGWWSATDTARWPRALDTWETIGLNTFPLFAARMAEDSPLWKLVEEARRRGFFIANIASPFHGLTTLGKAKPEVFHQFADGTVSSRLCPSYRGPCYQEEIHRFAQEMGRARPHFCSLDIELWGWRGPVDSKKCSRCQQDFAASGLKDWDAWLVAKGDAMWHDLVGAARGEIRKRGGADFEIGGYDFRPGDAYQNVWSFDRQYPAWMQSGQVSTYTCLAPHNLELIGNEARQDRARLPRSDLLPWITPGDAGTFPGEAFQWALLECYVNGARGIWFWSSRVWDAEDLIAYNRVIKAITPVEPILLDGELLAARGAVQGPGRLSGIRRGNDLVLLVADYFGDSHGSVALQLDLPARSEIRDLLADRVFAADVPAGKNRIQVPLEGSRARLLYVRPL
jgi:hypothetical protein